MVPCHDMAVFFRFIHFRNGIGGPASAAEGNMREHDNLLWPCSATASTALFMEKTHVVFCKLIVEDGF